MKKRLISLCSMMLLVLAVMAEGKPKYVFYFIGDGMGVNQVNAAETYLGALDGRIGISELCFPSFPYTALVNTQSATNGVTDSAAGGTALASGNKTKNGALGVLKDLTTPVTCIADWAREAGAAVGISTSVSVDHATPAAFYAHVGRRGDSYTIGRQLVESGNDFYAGSDFVKPENPDKNGPDLYQQAQDNGFAIARGYKDYQKKAKDAKLGSSLTPEQLSAFKHAKADAITAPVAGQVYYEFSGEGECAPCLEPFVGQEYQEGDTFCYIQAPWGEIVPIPSALGGKPVEVAAKQGAKVRRGDNLGWIERKAE